MVDINIRFSDREETGHENHDLKEERDELERLKLKMEIDRLKRDLQKWIHSEHHNIEKLHRKINFEITWWYIEKKVFSWKLKKWWIPSVKSKKKKYNLWYSPIIPSHDWVNRFVIELNSSKTWAKQLINIKYNWGNRIHILNDEWELIEIVEIKTIKSKDWRKPKGKVEIRTHSWKIVLYLERKRHYNYRRNKPNGRRRRN